MRWRLSSQLCLTGNVCGPSGTRPFVGQVRPEIGLRMRQESGHALGMHGAVRGPHPGIQGLPRMLSAPQMTRERGALASLERVTWNPVHNMI